MAFNYSDFCVLFTYRNLDGRPLDPTLDDLQEWNAQLLNRYENPQHQMNLLTIMATNNIDASPENKSWIVALAEVTRGPTIPARVKDACKYFSCVTRLPLSGQQLSEVQVTGRKVRSRKLAPKVRVKRKKGKVPARAK
jgi:hypothetical protein